MENSAGPAEMGTDVAGMELKLVQKPNIAYLMGESWTEKCVLRSRSSIWKTYKISNCSAGWQTDKRLILTCTVGLETPYVICKNVIIWFYVNDDLLQCSNTKTICGMGGDGNKQVQGWNRLSAAVRGDGFDVSGNGWRWDQSLIPVQISARNTSCSCWLLLTC